ncbi:TraG-like protein, N-terminal region [Rhodanobacter denitrificans]|uniref:TraG-like protein, N-terminal region n=1 Tax=Rhodanobacter denitrificans TaxID=666685 RepID=M4NEC9_9GAMM|nr:conjugal transfer protein TraG N-terminal domain-containing protein [Rhodanobacter denitrificans]AGG89104.1 TraG-like protein, N-terminal region [Rhodanobacter denitrificans]
MNWHIISIGDEAFLFKIFQFLSMLNSPGTDLYTKLGLLGGMVGLMLLLFQAVSSAGRQFNVGALLIGVVMFTVFFGTSTNVTLEDYHTGRTDIVSGVPLGTAFVGTMVSQSGASLIDIFQQGTTVPGHEVMHENYALEALSSLRGLTTGNLCDGNATLCPFTHTLVAYIHDCVLPTYNGIGRNGQTGWWAGDPSTADNALSAMAVTNDFLSTTDSLHDSGSAPTAQTCTTTYSDLVKASATTRVSDAMAAQALASAHQAVPVGAPPGTATAKAQDMLNNSYTAITSAIGDAQGAASSTMLNAVAADAMHASLERGRLAGSGDVANAALIASGAMARDVRYAAEQSMFGRTLVATITLFEGVIYGMAPFVAFLIPLGAVGIKFLVRYLQLLLWLFLWLPLMSFVNLYEIMAVTREMNALSPARGGGSLYSMVGIMEVQNSAADWVALGGWFTTSVIGFSGMVVFGSVAAFQSIASAAHGPDAVDPSGLAPNVMDSAPLVHQGNMFASSGGTAMMRSGAADFTVSLGGGLSAQESVKHKELVSAMEGFGMSRADAQKATWQDAVQWANTVARRANETGGVTHEQGDKSSDALKTADAVSRGVNGGITVTAHGAAGLGAEDVGATLNVKAGVTGQTGAQHAQTSSVGKEHSSTTTSGYSATDSRSSSVDQSLANSTTNGLIYNHGHDQAWNHRLDQTISQMREYDQTLSQHASIEAKASVSGAQIGSALPRNEEAYQSVMGAVHDLGGGEHFETLSGQLASVFPTEREARAVAAMETLQYLSDTGGTQGSSAVKIGAMHALMDGMKAVNPGLPSELGSSAMSMLGAGAAADRAQIHAGAGGITEKVDRVMDGHREPLEQDVQLGHPSAMHRSSGQDALWGSGAAAASSAFERPTEQIAAHQRSNDSVWDNLKQVTTLPSTTTEIGAMKSIGEDDRARPETPGLKPLQGQVTSVDPKVGVQAPPDHSR